jgi:pimeloyl-ACP methyl ester carboxylesterase
LTLALNCSSGARWPRGPTSNTRNPPSLRAPNGVLEDTFIQATGRRIWNASSIYVPVLVIAGEFDTWSFPEEKALRVLRGNRGLSQGDALKATLS